MTYIEPILPVVYFILKRSWSVSWFATSVEIGYFSLSKATLLLESIIYNGIVSIFVSRKGGGSNSPLFFFYVPREISRTLWSV